MAVDLNGLGGGDLMAAPPAATSFSQSINADLAAALAGVNPYRSAESFWLEFTGQGVPLKSIENKPDMDRGRRLEGVVLDMLAEQEGVELKRGVVIRDMFKPDLTARIDAIHDVPDSDGQAHAPAVVDAVVSVAETASRVAEQGLSPYWQARLQWNAALLADNYTPAKKVRDKELPSLCCAILDPIAWNLSVYRFPSDRDIQAELKSRAKVFMRCVTEKTPLPDWPDLAFPAIGQQRMTIPSEPELEAFLQSHLERHDITAPELAGALHRYLSGYSSPVVEPAPVNVTPPALSDEGAPAPEPQESKPSASPLPVNDDEDDDIYDLDLPDDEYQGGEAKKDRNPSAKSSVPRQEAKTVQQKVIDATEVRDPFDGLFGATPAVNAVSEPAEPVTPPVVESDAVKDNPPNKEVKQNQTMSDNPFNW